MATYSSGPEGIAELKKLATRLPQILEEIDTIRQYVYNAYEDNQVGLGEHTREIEDIITRMIELTNKAKTSLTGVAEDVMALAIGYEELASGSPYSSDI